MRGLVDEIELDPILFRWMSPSAGLIARERIQRAGLADRCECVGGNFFESVPQGADYYIIKHVLHDWDDEHAMEILRNVRKAAGPHSKLLVIEGLVEHNYVVGEFFRAWWDILQMTHTLGRSPSWEAIDGRKWVRRGARLP